MSLSWSTLAALGREHGPSYYVLDVRRFERNYEEFLGAFRAIYANSQIGYSYKTNYLPALCETVLALGGYAEVVSQMEYDLARMIGVPPSQIIFNGPLKEPEELENAILAGSLVNLDGPQEVEAVVALANRRPESQLAVGLRCGFSLETGRTSRFGFDAETAEFGQVFNQLNELPNCTVTGFHCHFSTLERSPESYAQRTQRLLELASRFFPQAPPRFLDLGGGFFGKMPEQLKRQFTVPIPAYADYAQAIAHRVSRAYPAGALPQLILEPGVALVADVLQFAARVVGLKRVGSRRLALVAGSIHNVKPTMTDKQLCLQVHRRSGAPDPASFAGPVDIVGYTCMEHDCLYANHPGPIGLGDYVVFESMGAYTLVFKPPFIRPNPPVLRYDSVTNEYSVVRRRETSQDVFSTYLITSPSSVK